MVKLNIDSKINEFIGTEVGTKFWKSLSTNQKNIVSSKVDIIGNLTLLSGYKRIVEKLGLACEMDKTLDQFTKEYDIRLKKEINKLEKKNNELYDSAKLDEYLSNNPIMAGSPNFEYLTNIISNKIVDKKHSYAKTSDSLENNKKLTIKNKI